MRHSITALAFALAGLIATPATAQTATVSYKGVITHSSGPQAGAFQAGQPIAIEYTVDTSVNDVDSDPGKGLFFNGLRALRVTVPSAAVDALTGVGTVQTFDNANGTSDQVFFYSPAVTAGQLQGLPVIHAEVDFIDGEPGPDGKPGMITSDAMPTGPLLTTTQSFAILTTSAGYTFVNFLAEPAEPTLGELVDEARSTLGDLVDAGNLRAGVASSLDTKLSQIAAAAAAGNTAGACEDLQALRNQIRALRISSRIDGATAAQLTGDADAIGRSLGC